MHVDLVRVELVQPARGALALSSELRVLLRVQPLQLFLLLGLLRRVGLLLLELSLLVHRQVEASGALRLPLSRAGTRHEGIRLRDLEGEIENVIAMGQGSL